MIRLTDLLLAHWATNQPSALPTLWYEYIPQEHAFPVCRFEITGFGRDYASSNTSMDRYQIEFNAFDTTPEGAFDAGQRGLSHVSTFGGDFIVNVRCVPETFATPVDAGGKAVWGFRFTAEITVIHEGG